MGFVDWWSSLKDDQAACQPWGPSTYLSSFSFSKKELSGLLYTVTVVLGIGLGKKAEILAVHYGNILSITLFSPCYFIPVLNVAWVLGHRDKLLISCEGCGDQMEKEDAFSSQVL